MLPDKNNDKKNKIDDAAGQSEAQGSKDLSTPQTTPSKPTDTPSQPTPSGNQPPASTVTQKSDQKGDTKQTMSSINNTSQPASRNTSNDNSSDSNHQNLSDIITTTPPSKSGRKKIIATIFSIILLVGGVITGVYLVRQQQELRRQAASASECNQSPDCEVVANPENSGTRSYLRNITHVFISAQTNIRFEVGDTNDGCYRVIISGGSLTWEKVGQGGSCHDVSNIQVWFGETVPSSTPTVVPSPTPTPTTPPGVTPSPTSTLPSPTPTTPQATQTPPPISAQCSEVKAYDQNWNLLSQASLSNLSPGDTVRFAVSGTASSGSFDRARFTINGQLQPETTSQKPGSSEFYIEYEIPEGTIDFVIDGEIHHSDLDWI